MAPLHASSRRAQGRGGRALPDCGEREWVVRVGLCGVLHIDAEPHSAVLDFSSEHPPRGPHAQRHRASTALATAREQPQPTKRTTHAPLTKPELGVRGRFRPP
eukprot:298297-Chlamydomonas_euryale.AAC.2